MDPRVRTLFKQLVYMGKDYPVTAGGYAKFMPRAKAAFRNATIANEADMEKALEKGQYIIKELEALYFLSRYRHLKRTYKE